MQVISRVIVSLVYYNSLVRDTLEYTMNNKGTYDVNFYNYKKNGIINELKLNTPLKTFIEKNGEQGEKLKEKLVQFGEDFYSDNSTVIKLASDGLRVDHAQNIKIFESVIPLHEELNSVVALHVNYAHEHAAESNLTPEDLTKLDGLQKADERFYRAVAFLTLSGEIFRQFEEYNKARREANGEKTPQSNFIEQDLNTLYKLLAQVRAGSKCTDEKYTTALDALFDSVEMMTGKRDLPKGKNFGDVINDVNAKVQDFIQDSEDGWRQNYTPLLNELIADSKKPAEGGEVKDEAKAS